MRGKIKMKKTNKKTLMIITLLALAVGGLIVFLCFYEPKLKEPSINFG